MTRELEAENLHLRRQLAETNEVEASEGCVLE
jgi:hypothetical protein